MCRQEPSELKNGDPGGPSDDPCIVDRTGSRLYGSLSSVLFGFIFGTTENLGLKPSLYDSGDGIR